MKKQRPINLNLFTIYFPIPAIVSILHRISGIILFLFIPFLLWILHLSLKSEQEFDSIREYLMLNPFLKFIIWGVLSSFIFHLIAGIRHLLMDIHIGDNKRGGWLSAKITMALSVIFIILLGIWLW